MSAKLVPSRKVVGCCGQMFNNHTYEGLPFEVKSASPNFSKYPHLKYKTAILGCHNCFWYGIKARAFFRMDPYPKFLCPRCSHILQFANLTREQSLLLAP